jgi:hypothetical protein
MKKFISMAILAMAVVACHETKKPVTKVCSRPDSTALVKPVKKVLYVCPMDSEVVSDKPDSCFKCGMDLIKKED